MPLIITLKDVRADVISTIPQYTYSKLEPRNNLFLHFTFSNSFINFLVIFQSVYLFSYLLLEFHCSSQLLLTLLGYYLLLTYLSHFDYLFIYFSYRAPACLCTGQPGVIYGPGKSLILNDKPIIQLDPFQLLFTHIRTIQSGVTSRTGLPQGTCPFLACLFIEQPSVMYVHSKSLNVNNKPVLQLDCSRLSGVR